MFTGPIFKSIVHVFQLFYMVKGDMCLKVVANDRHQDIHIKEGEVRNPPI